MSRFAAFTDNELTALWEGLTVDDGISYGIEDDDPAYPLVREIFDEAQRRGISGYRWEGVI